MVTEDKIMKLEACTYKDLSKYTKVFNKQTAEYHLWVYFNPEDVRNAYFYKAEEIGPNADNSRIFSDTFVRESQCWIRINWLYLNNSIGKHTIKFSFVDRFTDDDFSLYISYYIQDDSPERPYVYMHQEENDKSMPIPPMPVFTPYEG